jgi:hypothetical protein
MPVLSQALIAAVHESAIGPKRTSVFALRMSAFGGKADMALTSENVRFLPKADMQRAVIEAKSDGSCLRKTMINRGRLSGRPIDFKGRGRPVRGLVYVRYWPKADIRSCTARVRFRG